MNPKHLLVFATVAGLFGLPALAAPNSGNGSNNSSGSSKITLPDPLFPAGVLSATPKVVQAGTFPTLNWTIAYPTTVSDLAAVTPPAQITTLQSNTYVDVRVVGVGVTQNGPSPSVDTIPAEIRISVGGGNYTQLFYGTNADVDPTHSTYTKKHNKGTTINFGGRYVDGDNWSPFMTGVNSNVQIVALKNGDSIPTSYNLPQSGNMAGYLQPYVNSDNTVSIGANSLLVMAEYGGTDRTSASFDYQDFVALVNFSGKNNNGHGNNIDGVDSSNPGQGSGGPNGGVDPSGNFDDEGHAQHQ
ncbi:MAG: hypothetical protein ACO3SO_06615 [Luteolibacter sp.]